MEVTKNGAAVSTPPRKITNEIMQLDFEFEMVQKLTRSMYENGMISFEDFVIDRDTHSLIRAGVTYHLAPIEYAILMYFISTPGKIISPDGLYEIIWEKPGYGDVRTVVTHVYNLRKIVEPDISNPKYIINVRGYGYCFHPIGALTST